jgi:hypothetical protein
MAQICSTRHEGLKRTANDCCRKNNNYTVKT